MPKKIVKVVFAFSCIILDFAFFLVAAMMLRVGEMLYSIMEKIEEQLGE